MNKKSALIGLMALMMGAGCSPTDKPGDRGREGVPPKEAVSGDNSTARSGSGFSFFPFLLGYMLGNRGGLQAPGAAAPAPGGTPAERQAVRNPPREAAPGAFTGRGAGERSDLKARGSSSMRGSMGS